MTSPVEKVATAIKAEIGRQFDAQPLPGPPDNSDDWSATGGVMDLELIARAAIEAMREPSEAMLDAAVTDGRSGLRPRATVEDRIKKEYQAMISAALQDDDG